MLAPPAGRVTPVLLPLLLLPEQLCLHRCPAAASPAHMWRECALPVPVFCSTWKPFLPLGCPGTDLTSPPSSATLGALPASLWSSAFSPGRALGPASVPSQNHHDHQALVPSAPRMCGHGAAGGRDLDSWAEGQEALSIPSLPIPFIYKEIY